MMKHDPATHEGDAQTLKGRRGFVRILNAAGYSLAGLRAAYAGEAAFRQLVLLNVLLLPLACWVDVSRVERAMLMVMPLLALVVELINSAIEATVDRISLNLHPLSKVAKDMGSAAQMLALLMVVLSWALILL